MRQWEVAEWVNEQTGSSSSSSSNSADSRVLGKKRKARRGERKRPFSSDAATTTPIAWVALDDDDSLVNGSRYLDLCAPCTVLTDSRNGLTDADADRAIAILQQSMGARCSTKPESSNSKGRSDTSDPLAECANTRETDRTTDEKSEIPEARKTKTAKQNSQ